MAGKEECFMFEKRKLAREIKKCRKSIEQMEQKRSRSQSALVEAILLHEEPNEEDTRWFNKYMTEIKACRERMTELQNKLETMR